MNLAAAKRARPKITLDGTLPAPVGGINSISAGGAMPATDCIYLYNLIGAEYGLRTRLGFREHATGLGGFARSLIAFNGSDKGGTKDRLFATMSDGIFDATSQGAVGAAKYLFASRSSDSGYGISSVFVNAAGKHLGLYCDEENGYHVYDEATDTWNAVAAGGAAGQISGVDPATFCFVLPWKNRLWFVQKDTAKAWYLPIGQYAGTVQSFNFGSQFRRGGTLVGLWSWTIDGGAGIDDALVAISSSGDVAIYQGTDPAVAGSFRLSGVWSVGSVPAGRRIATDHGGDLLILSTTGIIPLSRLVSGALISDRSQYQTYKIANLFSQLASERRTLTGWAMALHPEDASLVVCVPVADGQATQQLAMSLQTKGWSQYRGLPITCMAPYAGTLYFGTPDGRVCANTGYLDGVTLAGSPGQSIEWSLLSAFQNLGSQRQKRVQIIRPNFLATDVPAYQAEVRYRWDLSEVSAPQPVAGDGEALWDDAQWDLATWAGDSQNSQRVTGATGCGVDVALAMRGIATGRTVFTHADFSWDVGGLL